MHNYVFLPIFVLLLKVFQLTVEDQMSCYKLFFSDSLHGHTRQSSSRLRMHWKSFKNVYNIIKTEIYCGN